MGKLTLLVKYKTKHDAREKFVNEVISSEILKKISEEEGFISYNYFYDAFESDNLLLVEEWESEEKQQEHLKTEHMMELSKIKEKYVLETNVQKLSGDN